MSLSKTLYPHWHWFNSEQYLDVTKNVDCDVKYLFIQTNNYMSAYEYMVQAANSNNGLLPLCHLYSLPVSPVVLIDLSLTVKAATLIFISGRGSAISSAKEGKSGFIYNLVKSY